MSTSGSSHPREAALWTPPAELRSSCALTQFSKRCAAKYGLTLESMEDLHSWSIAHPELFWPEVATFVGMIGEGSLERHAIEYPGAPTPLSRAWFPDFKMNFAENLVAGAADEAVVSWSEGRTRRVLTRSELLVQVQSFGHFLADKGIAPTDRVFGYTPNIPEAIVAMLGSTAVGATWSSCGTDYQLDGLISRLERTQPKVFVAATAYLFRGVVVSLVDPVLKAVERVPSIQHVVWVDYLASAGINSTEGVRPSVQFHRLEQITSKAAPAFVFHRFAPSHPVYVMFSSGTTGKPKGIVHGAVGTLIEHKKEMLFHAGLEAGDRLFYQTSTSWMMWNWLVSALSCGVTVLLYDGDPLSENGEILWRLVDQEHVTHFGTSAAFLEAVEKRGTVPRSKFDFSQLRALLSTGSTLHPSQFDFVFNAIKPLWLQSISGGTDIIGCFALGSPWKAVIRGELQAKSLGYDVCVYDEAARRIVEEEGELVCASPAPSMPVCFLDDPDGSAYRAAYFEHFEGVWRHGDYAIERSDGGLLFLGRSDATLKPGGVRVATADIYAALQGILRIRGALAVGYVPGRAESEKIILFVMLAEEDVLDGGLEDEVRAALKRVNVFYVPALVLQAPDLPRTANNKLAEVAVKKIFRGEQVTNRSALANPESLMFFETEGLLKVKRLKEGRQNL